MGLQQLDTIPKNQLIKSVITVTDTTRAEVIEFFNHFGISIEREFFQIKAIQSRIYFQGNTSPITSTILFAATQGQLMQIKLRFGDIFRDTNL